MVAEEDAKAQAEFESPQTKVENLEKLTFTS